MHDTRSLTTEPWCLKTDARELKTDAWKQIPEKRTLMPENRCQRTEPWCLRTDTREENPGAWEKIPEKRTLRTDTRELSPDAWVTYQRTEPWCKRPDAWWLFYWHESGPMNIVLTRHCPDQYSTDITLPQHNTAPMITTLLLRIFCSDTTLLLRIRPCSDE